MSRPGILSGRSCAVNLRRLPWPSLLETALQASRNAADHPSIPSIQPSQAVDFAVGYIAWTSGQELGGEYAARIARFLATINFNALQAHASTLRDNRPCTVSQQFSVGNFNIARMIRFDDGVKWVARLRMPPVMNLTNMEEVERYRRRVISEMESEHATMEFVRQNTQIPIPKVYDCDLDDQNPIGCPFTLVEYIHGNTAEDFARSFPGDHEGIPPEFEDKLWRQIARIMIQLASIRVSKIGSINRHPADQSKFTVGPLVETNTGPYSSATDFYAEYPRALAQKLRVRDPSIAGQDELLAAFRSLAADFRPQNTEDQSTFGLANYELNPSNILVDREFNILAVIDWDSVVAVPDAALYCMPFSMGIACPVPGIASDDPAVTKRVLLGQRFAEVVGKVASETWTWGRGEAAQSKHVFTRGGFFSKEAMAYRSLAYVKMGDEKLNSEWLGGLRWLKERDDAEVIWFHLLS